MSSKQDKYKFPQLLEYVQVEESWDANSCAVIYSEETEAALSSNMCPNST